MRLPRKSDARSYEVLHLSRKIISAKPEDLRLQNATPLRKPAPGPPNSSDEHVSCTAPATENASLQIMILFKCPTPAIVFENAAKPSRFAHFWQGAQSLAPATQNDIWTSKSGANMWCFVHFDFEMCFAPQGRALFRHLNFQEWSEPMVFLTFWLGNVLRATTACTFRHLNFQEWSEAGVLCTFWLENVLRATTACNFSFLMWPDGSAPAALASLLIDPLEKSLEKHSVSRLSYLFAHLHLLSSDSFSSLIVSVLLFSSLWPFPSLLFICPYCRPQNQTWRVNICISNHITF